MIKIILPIMLFLAFVLSFVLSFIGIYLVKDFRNGIIYNGFIGKIQKLIKH